MDSMSYTALRNNMASALDKVNDDHKPILITRRNGRPAVLISLDDYNACQETAYLMSSPANARRLNEAIDAVDTDQTIEKGLLDT